MSRRRKMTVPTLEKCCCLPLEEGCVVMVIISMIGCILNMTAGAWNLPHHQSREPEDNLISMTMITFSTLSLICNSVILAGMLWKRPSFMQFAVLFNTLFIVFNFLVCFVTIIFSPEFQTYLKSAVGISFVVLAVVAGASYSYYYILIVNSAYKKLKEDDEESVIPV